MKGDSAFNDEWIKYHKLPEKLIPISQGLKDRYLPKAKPETSVFLEKDEYTTGYERLAQTLKDDAVFGKVEFDLYCKGLKPEDLNTEFGGLKTKPFKTLK